MEFLILLTLFVTLLSFSTQIISLTKICAVHTADVGFDQDNVSVPQYDLRSHAAQVHDAHSYDASIASGCIQCDR